MELILLELPDQLKAIIKTRYPASPLHDILGQKNQTSEDKTQQENISEPDSLAQALASVSGSSVVVVYRFAPGCETALQRIRRKFPHSHFIAAAGGPALDLIQRLINQQLIDVLFQTPKEDADLLQALDDLLPTDRLPKDATELPGESAVESIEESMVTAFYIYDLIYGDLDKADRIRDLRDKYGLLAFPNCALTLLVDDFWEICRDLDNKCRYEIKMDYLNILRDFLKTSDLEAIACSLVGTDKLIALVHVPLKDGEDGLERVVEFAGALKKDISRRSHATVSIGIGNIYRDHHLIWKSYEESFRALEYTFHLGSDSVIHFEETRNFTTLDDGADQLPNYKYDFFKHINQWSEAEIAQQYEESLAHLISKSFNSETIKSIVIKYNFEILDYLEQLNFPIKDLSDYVIHVSTQILRASTMTMIQQINLDYIRRVAATIVSRRQADEVAAAIDSAKVFIEKYYYTELSLDLMAQVSNLSPAYFSRKFKQRVGLNYSDYLEKTRLEVALELLQGSEASLQEIASAAGFQDYSYFSSRFKKRYGQGPSLYRQASGNAP